MMVFGHISAHPIALRSLLVVQDFSNDFEYCTILLRYGEFLGHCAKLSATAVIQLRETQGSELLMIHCVTKALQLSTTPIKII